MLSGFDKLHRKQLFAHYLGAGRSQRRKTKTPEDGFVVDLAVKKSIIPSCASMDNAFHSGPTRTINKSSRRRIQAIAQHLLRPQRCGATQSSSDPYNWPEQQKLIPKLPIPALTDTCARYLESTEALLDDAGRLVTKQLVTVQLMTLYCVAGGPPLLRACAFNLPCPF